MSPLHPVEVGGDEVPLDAELVPVLGGRVLLFLEGQLPPEAVPCRRGRPEEVRSPLAGPLLLFPGLIEGVQQGGKAGIGHTLRRPAVLAHGHAGKVQGLAVPEEADGGKALLPDPVLEVLQSPPQRAGAPHLEDPGVHIPHGLEGELPGHEGGEAEVLVQQERVQGLLRRRGSKAGGKARLRLLQEGKPPCGGGGLVEKARQHLPRGGHVRVHPAEAVDDPALPVQQDQVGPAAHGLQHQRPPPRPAQLVGGVELNFHQPFQGRLGQARHPGPGEVLPEEHAEHGGLRRVVPENLRQLEAGGARPGVQQQALSPEKEDHLVPGGLVHLVHPKAQKLGAQLPRDGL